MGRLIFILAFLVPNLGFSQNLPKINALTGKPLLQLKVIKTGPYFGLQNGKFLVPEIGVERQWKAVRLKRTVTNAAHMGFNYNLKYNVLGYDVGYWLKPHRFGLTYGANLFFRTNFDRSKVGIAPVIGFKFWLLHIQTGYHFMTRPEPAIAFETNKFFISARIGIINDRDVDVKRRKKR